MGRDDDELRELRFERLDSERMFRDALDEGERAGRSFGEVVLEFLFRGDVIRVLVGDRAWTGKVVHAGAEVMTLETPAGAQVDLAHEGVSAIRVVERSRTGGRAPAGPHPGTMIARLRELALTGEAVTIGGSQLQPPLEGEVAAVAPSHIEFRTRDGGEWVVPLGNISYVVREAPADG